MAWSEIYYLDIPKLPYRFNLHTLSDLQLGNPSTSRTIIKARIEEIENDPYDCGVIIPGDIEDEDRPSTRSLRAAAFAGRKEVIKRDAQKHMRYLDEEVIPMLLPLQKTKAGIMGVLAGHHWTALDRGLTSSEYICRRIADISKRPVPYLGQMSSFMDMRFRRPYNTNRAIRIVGHVQHGNGAGQTKAASLAKLEQAFQSFEADFYIRAHSNQRVATMTDRLYPNAARLADGKPEMLHKTVAYLNAGGATRGYEMTLDDPSYIENEMMRPVTCGWGTVSFLFRRASSREDKNKNVMFEMRVTA
jgi:hypothetical protein